MGDWNRREHGVKRSVRCTRRRRTTGLPLNRSGSVWFFTEKHGQRNRDERDGVDEGERREWGGGDTGAECPVGVWKRTKTRRPLGIVVVSRGGGKKKRKKTRRFGSEKRQRCESVV